MSMSHDDQGDMPMTPGSMSDGGMNSTDMIMHMSFYWGKEAIILFSGWPEKSLGMYILALFFIFLLAFAVEILSIVPAVRHGTNPVIEGLKQAGVYALRMALAYLVMLSVMSYNLGIFIVAVAGHAVGLFIIKARAIAVANHGELVSSTNIGPKV